MKDKRLLLDSLEPYFELLERLSVVRETSEFDPKFFRSTLRQIMRQNNFELRYIFKAERKYICKNYMKHIKRLFIGDVIEGEIEHVVITKESKNPMREAIAEEECEAESKALAVQSNNKEIVSVNNKSLAITSMDSDLDCNSSAGGNENAAGGEEQGGTPSAPPAQGL